MENKDTYTHVRGESLFVDDIKTVEGTLYGYVFYSKYAHADILDLDTSVACKEPGVVRILTYKDIPGENQIGTIIEDETLLAIEKVEYVGQAIALVIADSLDAAKSAGKKIKLEVKELPAILDAKEAVKKSSFINSPRTVSIGDVAGVDDKVDYIIKGETYTGGQEHLYLETQSAYAIPLENGNIKIISSTQGPTAVQSIAARVLGIPMHKIEVEVVRLGGAFGGKEEQATPWAVMAALGVKLLKKPVKIILDRQEDMIMTGKRHPYNSSFTIGLNKDLKILTFEVDYYQNAGASADLSPAIAERTLFHVTNSYYIPNVRATLYSCKTNLPPNTAFRGFGGPQAMFVIEAAIDKAARELNVPAHKIQYANLIKEKDVFPYGQIASEVKISDSWRQLSNDFDIKKKIEKINDFNAVHEYKKRAYAFMPVTFGISFTNTSMNQARALVHVYSDGSVGISTGAVEMGQGVNTKLKQIAAMQFGLSSGDIKIETTNTTRIANTSPTAASSTTDLNGKALLLACDKIKNRLNRYLADYKGYDTGKIEYRNGCVFAGDEKNCISWRQLVKEALLQRINLSALGHYITPDIHYDKKIEKGQPFAYYVYGTAFAEVQLDCIRGIYDVLSVDIVHDFGKSLNKAIDLGQVEGALVQGIAWVTMEEPVYDNLGRLMANDLSSYKIPDIFSVPESVNVKALSTEGNNMAILKSKAVGEPPFMYGIAVYFAIVAAIKSFNPAYEPDYYSPMTPEKVLLALYGKKKTD